MDFQDWRDDICLVYGKTYARVRTAEVRRSINRPLLKSHVNGRTRVDSRAHAHAAHAHACPRTQYTYTCTHMYSLIRASTGPIHAKSSRELFFRLFAKESHGAFIIHCPYPLLIPLSFSLSHWARLMSPAFYCFALRSIDLPYLCFRRPPFVLLPLCRKLNNLCELITLETI